MRCSTPKARNHLANRQQLVIVDPDQIVAAQQWRQRRRKRLVDDPIASVIVAPKVDLAKPVRQQRPEHAIGKAHIEMAVIGFRQVDRRIGYFTMLDDGWTGNSRVPAGRSSQTTECRPSPHRPVRSPDLLPLGCGRRRRPARGLKRPQGVSYEYPHASRGELARSLLTDR